MSGPTAGASASRLTDEATIRAVIGGDKERYRELVVRHKDMIFALIMRQVGNAAIAEELAQETFVRAFVSLSRFRFETKFSTWLTRIALNQTSSYFTSRRYKQSRRTDEFDPRIHDKAEAPPEGDFQKERLQRFREALGTLKPLYREVIVLCALEGKSYEEAASILVIPIGTIRSRLNKARLLLKEALGGPDGIVD